jgi:hypothetical protein
MKKVLLALTLIVAAFVVVAAKPATAAVWPTPYGYMGNLCVTPLGTWPVNPALTGAPCEVVNPYTGVWATGYIAAF